jgi:hypothetical protein
VYYDEYVLAWENKRKGYIKLCQIIEIEAGIICGLYVILFGMSKSLKPKKVDFNELTRMLESYERKFGYSTIEFFRRYSDGKLGDDDEFMMWAGIYHLYLTSLPIRKFMREDAALAG